MRALEHSSGRMLAPVTETDFSALRALAETIWRQHYASIISVAQIEYMLAVRFSQDALREYTSAAGKWLELLLVSGRAVGYCGYELASDGGEPSCSPAMKLGQLYLLESHRGLGLGRSMLHHIEGRTRENGGPVLWLQVNKRNTEAIGFYRSAGFEVLREAVMDIGGGFVMDDYLMAKPV